MEGQGVYSPKEQYKQMFIEAVGKRSGSMVMWQVLDEIGFFNSPASANHHLNVPGGLLIHSLNVAKAAMELCEAEQFAQCDKNVVLTAALLHDVCKAGKYIAKPEGGYVSVNVTGTLRAQTHGHPPVVFQKSEDEGNET